MKKVLVVEDSNILGRALKTRIEKASNQTICLAQSYAEAEALLEQPNLDFLGAIVDLNLPDAPKGEILDLVIARHIPPIVFTAGFPKDEQEKLWNKGIVDYVLKDDAGCVDYLLFVLNRLQQNKSVNVLVCDDSGYIRKMMRKWLETHNFNVYEAANGQEALDLITQNGNIKLLITDYNMPVMDGFDLTRKARKEYGKNQLAIIGISAVEAKSHLSAKFLKHGANDFIIKPFSAEEFYCRVNQNIQTIEYIEQIKRSANSDYLTGLYNRRYFFEKATQAYDLARKRTSPCIVAMLDIDYFKKVNDTYGHDAGDLVLKSVAGLLRSQIRDTDILSRFGGEEFCLFSPETTHSQALGMLERIRKEVAQSAISCGDTSISVTVSIGLAASLDDSLEAMIKEADQRLYRAKEMGRNRVE